jgi:hypothetical protein
VFSICIYCKKSPPDLVPSEAHIFPAALGGTESSEEIVCVECNGRINREVETPTLPSFAVFRSLFGIAGRRGVPSVPGVAISEGQETPVSLGPGGLPKGPIIRVETDGQGKKSYVVYGNDEMIDAFKQKLAAHRPEVAWQEARFQVAVELVADGFGADERLIRRLAAKVVFERFAQLRGVIAADRDFDVIRDFILTGTESEPCCGITADPRLLGGSLNFPVPVHAVVIVIHVVDRIAGGFVVFFGLFLYWVILSRHYRALGSVDDLLLEYPQHRLTQRPLLRSGLGSVRVPWSQLVAEYTSDPRGVSRAAINAARLKFQAAVDVAFRESSGTS